MKMNLDDPKLTAYALDELTGVEKQELETAIAASPEAQEFVREVRLLSGNLRSAYAAEREHDAVATGNIVPLDQKDEPWSISRRLALAASLAILAVIGAIAIGTVKRVAVSNSPAFNVASNEATTVNPSFQTPVEGIDQLSAPPPPPPMMTDPPAAADSAKGLIGAAPPAAFARRASGDLALDNFRREAQSPFNTARYGTIEENPFLAAATNPLSTFSIDVDTASYANVRRFLQSNLLPPKDAVRIEELINYFKYDYPQPQDGLPFSVNLDAASCPWAPTHRLVRIGVKGREMPNEKRPASNLVFLLDVSGSMEPANRLPLVKRAMRLLIDRLNENDRVAIVVYAGASGLALPSTTGDHKEQILNALETLQSGGSTNGAEGISQIGRASCRERV